MMGALEHIGKLPALEKYASSVAAPCSDLVCVPAPGPRPVPLSQAPSGLVIDRTVGSQAVSQVGTSDALSMSQHGGAKAPVVRARLDRAAAQYADPNGVRQVSDPLPSGERIIGLFRKPASHSFRRHSKLRLQAILKVCNIDVAYICQLSRPLQKISRLYRPRLQRSFEVGFSVNVAGFTSCYDADDFWSKLRDFRSRSIKVWSYSLVSVGQPWWIYTLAGKLLAQFLECCAKLRHFFELNNHSTNCILNEPPAGYCLQMAPLVFRKRRQIKRDQHGPHGANTCRDLCDFSAWPKLPVHAPEYSDHKANKRCMDNQSLNLELDHLVHGFPLLKPRGSK